MNGPDHYKAAEQLLGAADQIANQGSDEIAQELRAEAQVHATLALAAATVYPVVAADRRTLREQEALADAWQETAR